MQHINLSKVQIGENIGVKLTNFDLNITNIIQILQATPFFQKCKLLKMIIGLLSVNFNMALLMPRYFKAL